MLGKYSKGFFITGFTVACFLNLPPLLSGFHSSSGFNTIRTILLPASWLFPFTEKTAGVTLVVAAFVQVFLNGAVYAPVGILLDNVIPALVTKAEHRIPIVPIVDLPMWRRTVVICSLVLLVVTMPVLIGTGFTICNFRPDHPDFATGQVYLVDDACHGSPRYVTTSEKHSYEFWQKLMFRCAAPLFVVAFLVWIPARPRSAGPRS